MDRQSRCGCRKCSNWPGLRTTKSETQRLSWIGVRLAATILLARGKSCASCVGGSNTLPIPTKSALPSRAFVRGPRCRRHPHVTTLHGRLDLPDLVPLYEEFREMPVVSISNNQRQPLPDVNWQATVYHGLPTDLLRYHPKPGQYLAFIGRFSPEKGADQAIEIAKRAQLPLKLAAKVDRVDEEYFEREIKPLLDHPLLEYVGEIGENDKDDFLGDAYALLFPIAWPEPFGLVMIEAMACGTPVIAYRHGSVPELMEDGRSGFIVNDVDGAVSAERRAAEVRRADVRNVFERRFTATQMASDYLRVYERVIAQHQRRARAPAA